MTENAGPTNETGGMEAGNAPPSVGAGGRSGPWMLWVRDVCFSVCASVLIITFLYQPVRVEGTSMLPRLEDHDRLFINKFVYHFEAIERDDVVVFHYPRNPKLSYIKRVIAIPGDRVEIRDGQVMVNGRAIDEPYVPEEYRDTRSMDARVVPQGEYFVLGDHRSIASDSRDFGMVARGLIYGKAEFVYWPRRDVGVVR
uniref:Signal peptidase I n=1 Tax=mine drainage metagenome TaxID=410659 RepID=E6QIH6_9ZZZZ